MNDKIPSKVDPQTQALAQAVPRPVVRFKRKLLIGIAATACLVVFGATWLALRTPNLIHGPAGARNVAVNHQAGPQEMSAMPSNYGQVKLGPRMPGDLGVGILERQKDLGVTTTDADNAASQAEEMRLAQQAQQAKDSGVLFQISDKGQTASSPAASAQPTGEGSSTTPLAMQNPNLGNDGLALDSSRDASSVALAKEDPNSQRHKLDFVNQKADADIYNPHVLQQPMSPYEILAGTLIPASLITGLDSDLPGLVIAQVTQNVFDSVTGTILLIPQGSRLIGSYDSVVAFGQSRALVVWQRIIMPNGSSIQIDNLPAADSKGYAGLKDQVDYHTWTLLKGIALSTLLGVGGQTTFGNNQSNLVEAIRESTRESTNQAGQRIVEKDLNVQPTLKVRPGWPLNVITHKDLVLLPYKR
ncbi:MAG: TrbI/VirB10 family protein [Alphaproteobacteria bacterium]|nr:TrbI/VirB10 family protein [Alphaproteobacteria bacterium]MDE2112217.1 TrbI/VirB10 family protein [Alphaproteobacteria bacterium]MDE2494149.1 TrbI/VirB10 family protein [Alphaproteobacteria bacterium]